MTFAEFIVTFAYIALVAFVFGILAYCVCTFVPKAIDFVKSFIRWHSHDDDDWYL